MDVEKLLSFCGPYIEERLRKYGNHSLSIGILHKGVEYYKDIGSTATPLRLVSSMTKSLLALAIGIMIADGQFDLDTKVQDLIPVEEKCKYPHFGQLQVDQLLNHETNLFRCDRLWEGRDGRVNIQTEAEIMELFNSIPPNPDFEDRANFKNNRNYVNISYALLALIIEHRTGISWTEFLRINVFDPLEMNDTTADLSTRPCGQPNIPAFCSQIDVEECAALHQDSLDEVAVHKHSMEKVMGMERVAHEQPVRLSRSCDRKSFIGAAAGIVSTTADFLHFCSWITESITKTITTTTTSSTPPTRQEAGFFVIWNHMKHKMQDPDCTYAAGWNLGSFPWDPSQRPPGADGESYRRLQSLSNFGVDGWNHQELLGIPVRKPGQKADLCLNHGGNMTGATSSVFVVPSKGIAVVTFAPDRNFIQDAANTFGRLLISCLTQRFDETEVAKAMDLYSMASVHCAAVYMSQVGRYQMALADNYENGPASALQWSACLGRYAIEEHIYIDIQAGPGGRLEFLQPYEKTGLPLRVKKGTQKDGQVTMSCAMSIDEAHKKGLGGSNWLDLSKSEITFQGRTGDSRYGSVDWTFENFPQTARPVFRRVKDS
jgi:CubicO group peptidase (beta-lactamase class C family)